MSVQTTNHNKNQISQTDQHMVAAIENKLMQLAEFNHATHVKLAYCYLVDSGLSGARQLMSATLKQFLKHHGVSEDKYHATITEGWLKAIWHFMQHATPSASADEFLSGNPVLLNKDILLSHYSHERLFSDQARNRYIQPDLNPFPED